MNVEFEGLGRRFVAALIDNATWFIGGIWLLSFFPRSTYDDHPEAFGLAVFVLASAWFNYFAIGEWRWQQTIGKNAMGMRVISMDRTRAHLRPGEHPKPPAAGGLLRDRLGDDRNHPPAPAPRGQGGEDGRDQGAKEGLAELFPGPRRRGGMMEAAAAERPPSERTPPDRGRLPEISWSTRNAVWGVIGGLVLANIFVPLVVLPFDPRLRPTPESSPRRACLPRPCS